MRTFPFTLSGSFAALILPSVKALFSPLRPPAIPLAVKSPYLSTWQQAGNDGGNGGYLAGKWPTFWHGQNIGWTGFIRVDGKSYAWMGDSEQLDLSVKQTAFEYTSTRSIFTMNVVGKVQMKITFLSPVSPDDLVRSSLPYAYLDVEVVSLDGEGHQVQIYTDISAEWASGDRDATAQWQYGVIQASSETPLATPHARRSASTKKVAPPGGVAYHKVWRQQQLEFSETNQQANWGYWYHATNNFAGLTYQSGAYKDVRGQFLDNGRLANTEDAKFRGINDNFPVFGFAVDLGKISTTSFEGADGKQPVPCLWTSYFEDETGAVMHFYNDYESCSSDTSAFDDRVSTDSIPVGGGDYLSLTSLAVRQAFGALEFTNTPDSPWIFLKEISSNGNTQTVDVLFPFHLIAVYTNATLLRYLLDPLFINQESGHWKPQFSIHDIGFRFPNATGHDGGNDEKQLLEECGNMLIMTLAYAQRTGDDAYFAQHYEILRQWNEYLVKDALVPKRQISTDDFAGGLANQTNLAIKGIIGIEAMAQIANRTGHVEDGQNFTKIAHDYVEEWMNNVAKSHTKLSYGDDSSWGLLYNLFGDRELGLELVPQSVYDMQSEFYPHVFNEFGVPLDTRHSYTKNDWQIFAASVASESTKKQFIATLAKWLGKTSTSHPFTDLYDTKSGDYPGLKFMARPVVGAMFALLALESAPENGVVLPS